MMRLMVLAGLCVALAGCGEKAEPSPAPKRISGVVNDTYYIHPRTPRAGRTVMKGCCTFELPDAKVITMTGDIDGRLVKGQGYDLDIAFGSRIPPLGAPFAQVTRRQIDGVVVVFLQGGAERYGLEAVVPLSDAAKATNIDFPNLQAVGTCIAGAGCERLNRALESIRF